MQTPEDKTCSTGDFNKMTLLKMYGTLSRVYLDSNGKVIGIFPMNHEVQDLLNAYAMGTLCVSLKDFNHARRGISAEAKRLMNAGVVG